MHRKRNTTSKQYNKDFSRDQIYKQQRETLIVKETQFLNQFLITELAQFCFEEIFDRVYFAWISPFMSDTSRDKISRY